MKRLYLECLIAAAALTCAPVLAEGMDEPIEVNTAGLPSHVAEQVKRHAAESERALMQYLWFTRRVNHLWLDDVATPKADKVALDKPGEERVVVGVSGK